MSQLSQYKRLAGFVRPHFRRLAAAFGAMFMNSFLSGLPLVGLIIPFVDTILAGKPIVIPNQETMPNFVIEGVARINALSRWELLNGLILFMIAASLLRAIFEYLQTYLMNDVSQRVIRDMRNQVYSKVVELPFSFFNKSQAGGLVSRITSDTVVVRDAISEGLTDFLFQPIQILVYLVLILGIRHTFGISWTLVLVICVLLPLVVYPVMRVGRRLKKISRSTQEQVASIHSTLFETISGIRIVQGFSMEKYEKDKFARQNQSLYKTMMLSISRLTIVSPLTEFVSIACLGAVLWMGGKSVIANEMSAGAFIAFLVCLLSLLRPFKRLSRVYSVSQHAMAAGERIFEILDTRNDIQDKPTAVSIPPLRSSIEFENVGFHYGENPVLKNVSLKVRAGEILALVGPSGAGKTTFVNLLPRFFDVTEGRIRIDGVDIRDVTLKSLRHQIGIVTQDTVLFNETVFANIAYGLRSATQQDVETAAKIANAHRFIENLPLKYQTLIGDRGVRLSGGERQRLSIARAVLKNPPILILDEATSSLDTESEVLVQEAIHNLMRGRTVLVIAHRLSTIRDANRIVVLDQGEIVESGTHEELIAKNGLYKHLHELQFRV